MRTKATNEILSELTVFRTADAVAAGISQPTLSRLAASGKVTRLEHGLYLVEGSGIEPDELDFAIACTRFGPKSVIGGLTALFRYGLVPQVPDRIWINVPPNVKPHHPYADQYRCVRTKNDPSVAVETRNCYRIVTVERSVAEALQFASKLGAQVAISAARSALRKGSISESQLYDVAAKLGTKSAIEKHWEAITSE